MDRPTQELSCGNSDIASAMTHVTIPDTMKLAIAIRKIFVKTLFSATWTGFSWPGVLLDTSLRLIGYLTTIIVGLLIV
ncbi:MAG: hypothetical protein ACKVIK_01710 [Rhodospirillales bacterium]